MNSFLRSFKRGAQYKFSSTLQNFRSDSNYIQTATTFVNSGNFSSNTRYFIWVDTKNFKTNIFTGSKNNWTLIKSYLCTIGKPSTPTPKGNFTVGIKGPSFGEEKGYRCLYYTQITGNYLFHSIIYNLNGSIRDGRLGMRLSDGCVRLATENAKWLHDNVPHGSAIHIS